MAQAKREKSIKAKISVTGVMGEVRVRDELEAKAFAALESRLEPRKKMCVSCKGEGCKPCEDRGYVMEAGDMRAIELVLSPKFPKTSISVSAELDGMGTKELLAMIEGM